MHAARRHGVTVFRREPERVGHRITQGLLVLGVPALVAVVLHVHLEAVDLAIRSAHDVQEHFRLVVAVHLRAPVERGFPRIAVAVVALEPEARHVALAVVHFDALLAAHVFVVLALRLHPVLVLGVVVAQGLLVREHVGALGRIGLHLELVVDAVIRVGDDERGAGLFVPAFHDRRPHELRLLRRAVVGGDAEELDHAVLATVALAVVVVAALALTALAGVVVVLLTGFVVPGVAVAAHRTFTVVPAVLLQIAVPRERLRLDGRAVLVERDVQVGTRVVAAGRPDHVAGVTHRAKHVGIVQRVAFVHPDFRQVAVAADIAVAVVDQDRVAIAVIAVALGRHFQNHPVRHGRDRLAVRVAPILGEIERVRIVAVVEPVVDVGALVVALREDPVLARREGQLQEGTPPDAVRRRATLHPQDRHERDPTLLAIHFMPRCAWLMPSVFAAKKSNRV